MSDYDVIVVGGGSAGSAAAAAASAAGARTLMVNDGELGGLCILRGCMPTKTLLATAHAIHESEHLDPLGAHLEGRVVPDFPRIMERKTRLVERFQRAKIDGIESNDYEVLFGRARFVPGGAIEVDGRRIEAERYVISTGSHPITLPIPGIDDVPVWSSDDVMRLESPPESLLVQGAGPIGLELAQFFARIGSRVLVVNRSPLLCRYDVECGDELTRALAEEPRFELAAPGHIEALAADGAGLVARVRSHGEPLEVRADALLMAAGRAAALEGLGLEHTRARPEAGRLPHDEGMGTGDPRIWVAGDATGTFQILHLANQEGSIAGHNAAVGRRERTMDYRLRMSIVFTDPVFAQIGLNEDRAEEEGRAIVVGRARFPETGRAITMGVRHGLWKILADRDTGEIVGASILGPRADDLIHLISLLMHQRARAPEVPSLPWYHPTLSEVILDVERDISRQREPPR